MAKNNDTQKDQLPQKVVSYDEVMQEADIQLQDALNGTDKEQLADSGVPFYIVDCTRATGKYTNDNNPAGYYWILDIEVGNQKRLLFMSWHPKSEAEFSAYLTRTKTLNHKIGPVSLERIELKDGNSFYKIGRAQVLENQSQELLPF